MRIAVEVLVPLRLFFYRFLSERRRSLLLALAVVAHLNLKFFKKIQIGGTHYGLQQSQRRKEMAALSERQLGWNSRGVSSLLTVWRLPIAFRGVEDKLKCFYHISQTKGGHKNRDIVNILPTLNTSFCLAAYIGRTNLPESRWEVKHNGKNY